MLISSFSYTGETKQNKKAKQVVTHLKLQRHKAL